MSDRLECGCPANGYGHAAWCVRNATERAATSEAFAVQVPAFPPGTGPGSISDAKKAISVLEALMVIHYPNATGYSHAMMLIARDVQALRRSP